MANDDDGPHPRPRPPLQRMPFEYDYDDVKDSKVRDFILRAGRNVNVQVDWERHAEDMAYLRALRAREKEDDELRDWVISRRSARQANIHNRTRLILWVSSGIGLAVIEQTVQNGFHWMRIFLP